MLFFCLCRSAPRRAVLDEHCLPQLAPKRGSVSNQPRTPTVVAVYPPGVPGLSEERVHPPFVLVKAAVGKACADRALCALLVPVAILQQHWGKLLAASVLLGGAPYADSFRRIRDPDSLLPWPDAQSLAALAIFACDFGRLEPRAGLPLLFSCPAGASARRSRHLCGSAADVCDRYYLRGAMLAQRCGPQRDGDGAGPPCGAGPGGH